MGADSTLRNTALEAHAPSPLLEKKKKKREGWRSPGPAGVFLGQRTPIRSTPKPRAQGARVIGEAGRGLPRDVPQGFGARHPPGARFLHTGGRAERRLPTDLRPPGPGRSRLMPRGPDAEVSRRPLGCSATGRAEQPAAPPCGPDVQCAKRKGGLAPDSPARGTAVGTPQERSRTGPLV